MYPPEDWAQIPLFPFDNDLLPPEMIMQRQGEIGLSDAQRDQIRAEVQKAQGTMTEAQWRIAGESEKLHKLLAAGSVGEARVLAQVDAILAIEREVKRTHITMLVRIRNALSAEQRARLAQMRDGLGVQLGLRPRDSIHRYEQVNGSKE
jgi:Spy/CpxP family protein refolding chaperone